MRIQRSRSTGTGLLAALLLFSASACATTRCPPEFGQNDPLVNVLGWLVVAVGMVVGGWLFAYSIRRSRGMRWLPRGAVIASGFAGMVALWVGGLALAFVYFFLQC